MNSISDPKSLGLYIHVSNFQNLVFFNAVRRSIYFPVLNTCKNGLQGITPCGQLESGYIIS